MLLWNVKSFPRWRGLWGVVRERVANNCNKQLLVEWMRPCRAPRRLSLAALGVWCSISLILQPWWFEQEGRRPVHLSVCPFLSLFLAMKSEGNAEEHLKLFALVWVLNPNSSADGVLLIMLFGIKYQKHRAPASSKEPTGLFVEHRTELPALVPAAYGIFHCAHRWAVLMCWAAATIKDVSPVTSKFIIVRVRWGWRRASGVNCLWLCMVTQLCEKTEVCKVLVERWEREFGYTLL